jgi:hypothetical protein
MKNELRLGNLVTIGDGAFPVTVADLRKMNESEFHCYRGILITSDWLDKLKFETGANKHYRFILLPNQSIGESFIFINWLDNPQLFSTGIAINDGEDVELSKNIVFRFVHQLQNIYFAMTGEELIVNEQTESK